MEEHAEVPVTRQYLLPAVRTNAQRLAESLIADPLPASDAHLAAADKLAGWIAEHYRPNQQLAIICICTGNSRRSFFAEMMGNVAALYYGLPRLSFYSGGTEPSALNPRTITALESFGLEIEPAGGAASAAEAAKENPRYEVRWANDPEGNQPSDAVSSLGERMEMSKRYDDASLPQKDFAALLVCSAADEACPIVPGAAVRIPSPFEDPKESDGTPAEAATYAERRDQIGRVVFTAVSKARAQLLAELREFEDRATYFG